MNAKHRVSPITFAMAKELLSYCPESGDLRWRNSPRYRIPAGSTAGCPNKRGYRLICLLGKKYYAHRLIWLLVHGEWPACVIDHIDGDITNNRLANLRCVTQQVNVQNKHRAASCNKTGLLGVRISKNKFYAQIKVNGSVLHLGTYETSQEAHNAYLAAKRELHAGCDI